MNGLTTIVDAAPDPFHYFHQVTIHQGLKPRMQAVIRWDDDFAPCPPLRPDPYIGWIFRP